MVIFEMLVARGARLNAKNHGGDTPLHLASSHGKRDIVQKVLDLNWLAPLLYAVLSIALGDNLIFDSCIGASNKGFHTQKVRYVYRCL